VGEVPAPLKAMMPVQLLTGTGGSSRSFRVLSCQINKKGRPNSRPFAIAMF
jgi:hypothetical protein